MSGHVRITRHPNDPSFVLAHVAPNLAPVMGGYLPARWSKTDKAYVLPESSVDQFGNYLRHHAVKVLDDRGAPPPTKRSGPLPECARCATPAHPDRQPSYCPGCGQPWEPVTRPTTPAELRASVRCPACGRRQSANSTWCIDCGRDLVAQAQAGRQFDRDRHRASDRDSSHDSGPVLIQTMIGDALMKDDDKQ